MNDLIHNNKEKELAELDELIIISKKLINKLCLYNEEIMDDLKIFT